MTEKKNVVLPEAPASVSVKIITQGGLDMLFTLRDVDDDALLDRCKKFVTRVEDDYDVSLAGNGNGNQSAPLPESGQQNVSQATPDLYFDAVELVGESSGGKDAWKVKGGKWTQWGVRIWPEVLDAAGIPSENLDVDKTYKLDGYTAYYVENDQGNPQKVVNLAKA